MSRQALGEIEIIGELTYFKSSESENSSIHDGTFISKLKIKVRTVEDNKVNKIEVERFLKLKAHPNVQRLFCYEFYESIHHFGLQTYDFNLYDFMQISKNKRIKIDPISMVKDVTEGLNFLHTNEIIHGNLNFKNVGINKAAKRTMLCYCGFDDLQEDQNIFITPEEVRGDNPSS
ncbi:hypothetical protein ACKWTF_014665 [Chironomus riparius]